MNNRLEYFESVYAAADVGATVVPLNPRHTPSELSQVISAADLSAVVVEGGLSAVARDALPEDDRAQLVVVDGVAGEGEFAYEDLVEVHPTGGPLQQAEEMMPFWLASTGGTTSSSRLCEILHRSQMLTSWAIHMAFGLREDDAMLVCAPLYHGLGLTFSLYQLMVGGRVIVQSRFSSSEAIELIDHGATVLVMSPTMYSMLLAEPGFQDLDRARVRCVIVGGGVLHRRLKESLCEAFPAAQIFDFYGSTEGGLISALDARRYPNKLDSVGLPAFGCEVQVRGESGDVLPSGETGEIFNRGLSSPARAVVDTDGTVPVDRPDAECWVSSGDLGYLDDDGFLYIADRKKDVIIRGGVNITSGEVEAAILKHPDVWETAVVGVPDEMWGETVKAFVVPRPGAAASRLLEQLPGHCRHWLASYKVPVDYELISELPRNDVGKVLKRELKTRETSI